MQAMCVRCTPAGDTACFCACRLSQAPAVKTCHSCPATRPTQRRCRQWVVAGAWRGARTVCRCGGHGGPVRTHEPTWARCSCVSSCMWWQAWSFRASTLEIVNGTACARRVAIAANCAGGDGMVRVCVKIVDALQLRTVAACPCGARRGRLWATTSAIKATTRAGPLAPSPTQWPWQARRHGCTLSPRRPARYRRRSMCCPPPPPPCRGLLGHTGRLPRSP